VIAYRVADAEARHTCDANDSQWNAPVSVASIEGERGESIEIPGGCLMCFYEQHVARGLPIDAPIGHFARYNAHGILPFGGGWMEQPALYCDSMDVLAAVHGEAEKRRMNAVKNKSEDSWGTSSKSFS